MENTQVTRKATAMIGAATWIPADKIQLVCAKALRMSSSLP